MVNILHNNTEANMYHYFSDIVSPSLSLIAEMCPRGPVDMTPRNSPNTKY